MSFPQEQGNRTTGKGSEASWIELGFRMQMVGWQHMCVHIKKSPLTQESQWDGIGKLYSSEERGCLNNVFSKLLFLEKWWALIFICFLENSKKAASYLSFQQISFLCLQCSV